MTLRCSSVNRSRHQSRGGAEKKHARHLLTVEQNKCLSVAERRVRHSIHCNAEWKPIRYAQSYVALGSGTDGGRRNRSRYGIDQSLANASQLGKGFKEPSWFEPSWCCSMIPRSPRSKRTPSPSNLRAIRCYEKAGFERQGTVTTPDGPAVYMVSGTPGIRANTQCCLTLPSRTSKAGASGRPSCPNVKHHEGKR